MSKIDLINDSWVDLVFESKNKSYGAYQLRKNTGKRNVKSMIIVFGTIAAILIASWAKVAIENAMPKKVAIETDVELSKLAQKKEPAKVERKEPVKVEMEQKVVEKVKSSVKFTAPEIKKDDEVKPEDELKSQDELSKTNTAIGSFDVKGNDEAAGEVLKAKEVIADEKPKEEETKVFDVVEQMPQFPGGNAYDVIGKYVRDKAFCIRSADEDFSHMGDIKHSYSLSDGIVLRRDVRILDRHQIARELQAVSL